MGGAKYNPVSEAGADDAIDPAVAGGNQLYKKLTAVSKNPVPLHYKRLGLGSAAGIAAESTTQNMLDNIRGGKSSDNPYVANLERLASRMVGGATSGAIYGKNPASAIIGAISGAAIDTGENIYGIATAIPELLRLKKEADLQLQKDRAEFLKTVSENVQEEQKKRQ